MSDVTRVVLVKPGDVLIFGNVGVLDEPDLGRLEGVKEALGLAAVWVFEADIDLAAVTGRGDQGQVTLGDARP